MHIALDQGGHVELCRLLRDNTEAAQALAASEAAADAERRRSQAAVREALTRKASGFFFRC